MCVCSGICNPVPAFLCSLYNNRHRHSGDVFLRNNASTMNTVGPRSNLRKRAAEGGDKNNLCTASHPELSDVAVSVRLSGEGLNPTPSSVSTQMSSVGRGPSTGYCLDRFPFLGSSIAPSGPGEMVARCTLVTALVRSLTQAISA